MAIERKSVELHEPIHGTIPEELARLLDDGWYVRYWTRNEMTRTCTFNLEREVPDHDQKRT